MAEDRGDYTRKVRDYDPDARLVAHVGSGQIGVARWVLDSFAQGGAWMIAFRARDEDSGDEIHYPDERVLQLQKKFDTWARKNPKRLAKAAEETLRRREEFISDEARAVNYENALKFVHDYKRASGNKSRALGLPPVPTAALGG